MRDQECIPHPIGAPATLPISGVPAGWDGAARALHLAFVTPTYPPENGWGGIGTYTYHLARGLAEIGHRISILCGVGDDGEPRSYKQQQNLTVHRLLRPRPSSAMRGDIADALWDLCRSEKFDVVEFPEYGALGLDWQRSRPSAPTVVRLHGDTSLCAIAASSPIKNMVRLVLPGNEYRRQIADEIESLQRADLVTAPSKWALARVRRRGWLRPQAAASVLPNPFRGFPQGERTFSPAQDPGILFLGRLDYGKGANLIPGVISRVHAQRPDVRFTIVGQTRPRHTPGRAHDDFAAWIMRTLPRTALMNIDYIGGVPYPELPRFLTAGSIACFLSTIETFGYTHVEAMWSGLATIIASGGGARELGTQNRDTVYVQRTPHAVATAALHLLAQPIELKRIAAEAHATARTRFGSDTLVRHFAAAYSEIATT